MSFADDLAQMHADCDEAFSPSAWFRPADGGEHLCAVEVFQPEPIFGGEAKTAAPEILLRVVKASLPKQPIKDDVFEIVGGNKLRVLEKPGTEDDDGLRWTIKAAKVR